ncbi:Xaa-Pro aminopeptidase [Salegentibacter salinarum]|uniref:Xaa-Pro aminopeptidase n=1 Tax=Salegentibacter salinarum TaxID=447422 RepID=A0A2N0U477_9FLAO|nr:aminopeptidase P family protein [Salegentibacter salinarum]PKD21775.1 Xaa-Pro aminopeptidase [Salegentibacter salinarum]SKB33728.1 Xaa-Pro aminopeptidase [Salegentibacter salinarum]
MFSTTTYTTRREALKKKMKSGILIFPGNKETGMNYKDNWYPFRQDSSFLYYFGINLPDLYVIIDLDEGKEILFGDDLTPEDMVWVGASEPLANQAEKCGIKEVQPTSKVKDVIQKAKQNGQTLHYLPPYRSRVTIELSELLGFPVSTIGRNYSIEFVKAVIAQRSIKSSEEIKELHKAVNITASMHRHAIKNTKHGVTEKQIAGELQAIAIAGGGNISFPIILTKNGQYLHNHATQARVENGDIVLCDCGAETEMGYAGDMTRTFPVAERFTDIQREIYSIVLEAHESAAAALKPGYRFKDAHLLACTRIVEGLKGLGLMKGDTEEAVNAGAHTLFFQCGLGHFMGLDVHDMENFGEQLVGYNEDLKKSEEFGLKSLRLGKELEAGNVLTVEPGIYFNPFLIDSWKAKGKYTAFVNYDEVEKFKTFGGMRVEEDFLITSGGKELLGDPLAKTIEEIEELKNA